MPRTPSPAQSRLLRCAPRGFHSTLGFTAPEGYFSGFCLGSSVILYAHTGQHCFFPPSLQGSHPWCMLRWGPCSRHAPVNPAGFQARARFGTRGSSGGPSQLAASSSPPLPILLGMSCMGVFRIYSGSSSPLRFTARPFPAPCTGTRPSLDIYTEILGRQRHIPPAFRGMLYCVLCLAGPIRRIRQRWNL